MHNIAGRMTGDSGIVTFCTCGLGFFAIYPVGPPARDATQKAADGRWAKHAEREQSGTAT